MVPPSDDEHGGTADSAAGSDAAGGGDAERSRDDAGGDDERPGTGPGAAGPGPGTDDAEGPFGLERRTLIRLLVGLGIGVPILIEAATLLGLVGDLLGGDDGGAGTPTATETTAGVGLGDELLPDAPGTHTVQAAYVAADGWTFTLSVGVENTTDRTYELRLRTVTTDGGDVVEGGGESGPIAPGETGSVTGRWDLPDGASPDTVEAVAIVRNGTVTTVERTVDLGSVPVQGG